MSDLWSLDHTLLIHHHFSLPDLLMNCTLLAEMRRGARHAVFTPRPVGLLALFLMCLFPRTEPFLIQHHRGYQGTEYQLRVQKRVWTTTQHGVTTASSGVRKPGPHLYGAQSMIQADIRTADEDEPAGTYLILFKGGASGREDAGHSLTEFRQSEFRAIAAMCGVRDSHLLTFRDALITDLAEAAGLSTRAEDDGEDEEDEEGERGDGSSLQWIEGPAAHSLNPEVLSKIVSRLVLTHAIYEVWASGKDWVSCAKVAGLLDEQDARLAPLFTGKLSWSGTLVVFGAKRGRRRSLKDLPSKLSYFSDLLLRLPGPVRLKSPQASLVILQDGDEAEGEPLHQVYLTREVGRGPRGLVRGLSLKTRAYVSTTSMDARASLVMANMAQVSTGDRVLDPYCGSAGLLLAAAKLGASEVVGVDVNATISLPKVWGNFEQQKLPPPSDYLFGDVATQEVQAQLRGLGPFDVILSDPPYGKREKGSFTAKGAAQEATHTILTLAADNHILKVGGRLVFFVPSHPRLSPTLVALLPRHPCLALVDASCQRLNANLDRWLITLHKVRESVEGDQVEGPSDEALRDAEARVQDVEEDLRIWHYTASAEERGGGGGGDREEGV